MWSCKPLWNLLVDINRSRILSPAPAHSDGWSLSTAFTTTRLSHKRFDIVVNRRFTLKTAGDLWCKEGIPAHKCSSIFGLPPFLGVSRTAFSLFVRWIKIERCNSLIQAFARSFRRRLRMAAASAHAVGLIETCITDMRTGVELVTPSPLMAVRLVTYSTRPGNTFVPFVVHSVMPRALQD